MIMKTPRSGLPEPIKQHCVSSQKLHCQWRSVTIQMETVFYIALLIWVAVLTCDGKPYKPSKYRPT